MASKEYVTYEERKKGTPTREPSGTQLRRLRGASRSRALAVTSRAALATHSSTLRVYSLLTAGGGGGGGGGGRGGGGEGGGGGTGRDEGRRRQIQIERAKKIFFPMEKLAFFL